MSTFLWTSRVFLIVRTVPYNVGRLDFPTLCGSCAVLNVLKRACIVCTLPTFYNVNETGGSVHLHVVEALALRVSSTSHKSIHVNNNMYIHCVIWHALDYHTRIVAYEFNIAPR